jgi:hypothetical protein
VTLLFVSNAVTAVGNGMSLRRLLPLLDRPFGQPSETSAAAASASRQMPLGYVPTAAAAGRRMRVALSGIRYPGVVTAGELFSLLWTLTIALALHA